MPKYQVNTPVRLRNRIVKEGVVDIAADEAVELLARGLVSPLEPEPETADSADASPPARAARKAASKGH